MDIFKGIGKVGLNVGQTLNAGLDIGTGRSFQMSRSFRPIGTMLSMGALGAGVGASASALGSNGTVDPGTGALVGGMVGAAAIPTIGLTAGVAGSAIVGAAKMLPKVATMAGKGAIEASPFIAATGARAAANAGGKLWNVGSKMVRLDEGASALEKVKFTKLGKAMLIGTAATEGFSKALHSVDKAHMGTIAGVQTMTPKVPNYSRPSYDDNSGATGDLVFALNANRRG